VSAVDEASSVAVLAVVASAVVRNGVSTEAVAVFFEGFDGMEKGLRAGASDAESAVFESSPVFFPP
jgi:hypothetical protein